MPNKQAKHIESTKNEQASKQTHAETCMHQMIPEHHLCHLLENIFWVLPSDCKQAVSFSRKPTGIRPSFDRVLLHQVCHSSNPCKRECCSGCKLLLRRNHPLPGRPWGRRRIFHASRQLRSFCRLQPDPCSQNAQWQQLGIRSCGRRLGVRSRFSLCTASATGGGHMSWKAAFPASSCWLHLQNEC